MSRYSRIATALPQKLDVKPKSSGASVIKPKGVASKKIPLTFKQKNPKAFKNDAASRNAEHSKMNPSKAKRFSRMEKPGYEDANN